MAMERSYDATLKNAMVMERCFLSSHRNIAPSPSRLAQNAMVHLGQRSYNTIAKYRVSSLAVQWTAFLPMLF